MTGSTFLSSLQPLGQMLGGLSLTIGLFLVCAVLFERLSATGSRKFLNRGRRLEILDHRMIGKHRIVLLRRDNTEHLLALGENGILLVESHGTTATASDTTRPATLKKMPGILHFRNDNAP